MGDPYSEGINEIGDVPPHYLREVEHFFKVYKDLEGTRTESRGFEGAAAARQAITQAMRAYDERFGGSR
jgi:inorganic pyrophosphatase